MDNDGDDGSVSLLSADYRIWHELPITDMVALYAREYPDPIPTWITETALGWYHDKVGHHFSKVCCIRTSRYQQSDPCKKGPKDTALAKT